MKKIALISLTLLFLMAASVLVASEEAVDLEMVSKIREEGINRSKVMDILFHLTDVSGPRLTASPELRKALDWGHDELQKWGLKNVEVAPWGDFGVGWSLKRFSMHMVEPYYSPIIAFPKAWTRGTDGLIKGRPLILDASSKEDLKKYSGKLKGVIVLMPLSREAETHFDADADRYDDQELEDLESARFSGRGRFSPERIREFRARRHRRNEMRKALEEAGVAAVLEPGFRGEHGTLFVSSGGSWSKGLGMPAAVVAVEHYARMIRLLKKDIPVELEMEIQTEIQDQDKKGYNLLAELPGSDLADEVVMLGGHIDSWHAATGATDNAAGCAVMMEALRILKDLGVQPRRTIRLGLWSGEEQGLLGSRAYVTEHFGDRKTMDLKPAHQNFSAYFNLDNGTGKIRGVYLQGNAGVAPIFEAYLKPFHDMGATTLTMRNTGGTDHLAFDSVGLPGFQFIQDPIDYSTRTHHTNMDFYDHAIREDLMQASVIVASFVYHTAMRDEKLPRKALPKRPKQTPPPAGGN